MATATLTVSWSSIPQRTRRKPGVSTEFGAITPNLNRPLKLGDGLSIGHYTMASLQTGTSGIGTIIHEMLHQMGAIDLYPVHDEVNAQSWKGPGLGHHGQWNWNGGGRWPPCPRVPMLNWFAHSELRHSVSSGRMQPPIHALGQRCPRWCQ